MKHIWPIYGGVVWTSVIYFQRQSKRGKYQEADQAAKLCISAWITAMKLLEYLLGEQIDSLVYSNDTLPASYW
jgi:hypothetical protein